MINQNEIQDFLSRAFSPLISDAIQTALGKLVMEGKLTSPIETEKPKEPDELWTIAQVCSFLHVSKPTFHAFVHRGLIHPRKAGQRTLISRDEVLEKLASGQLGKYRRTSKVVEV